MLSKIQAALVLIVAVVLIAVVVVVPVVVVQNGKYANVPSSNTVSQPEPVPSPAPTSVPVLTSEPSKLPTKLPVPSPSTRPSTSQASGIPTSVPSLPSVEINQWTALQGDGVLLADPDQSMIEHYGSAVAISHDGSVVAVGSGIADNLFGRGMVKIFHFDDNIERVVVETHTLLSEFDGLYSDWFGRAISLSADGTRLAVGRSNAPTNGRFRGGAVNLYEYTLGAWRLAAKFERLNAPVAFGDAVSISGDGHRLAMGDGFNSVVIWCDSCPESTLGNQQNNTFVNETIPSSSVWQPLGTTLPRLPTHPTSDKTWLQLSRDGTTVVVSYLIQLHVLVYRFNGTDWEQQGSTLTGNGFSVAISGTGHVVAIGDMRNSNLKIYEWEETDWQLALNVTMGESEGLGQAVSLSDDGRQLLVAVHSWIGGRNEAHFHQKTFVNNKWGLISVVQGAFLAVAMAGNGRRAVAGAPKSLFAQVFKAD